jgi:hypothetical protein
MRKFSLLLLIFSALSFIGCSGDDDTNSGTTNGDNSGDGNGDGNGDNTPTFENFLPLTIANFWRYDVNTTDDQGTPPSTSTDEITTTGTTTIGTLTYFTHEANADATGTMTGLLTQNVVRNDAGKYHMDGELVIPLGQLGGDDVVITLNDALFLDESASDGAILSTQSGTITQTIQTLPMTIEYTLETVQQEALSSHMVAGDAIIYNDILKSQIILRLSVATEIAGFPITVLAEQDVLTIDNFYANAIGLVDSDSVFTYTLNTLPVDIGIPDTVTTTTTQELTDYTVSTE